MSMTGDVETLNSLWRLIMQQSRASASEHTSKGDSLYAACEIFVLMDFLHVWTALNKMENNPSVKKARAVHASKPFPVCTKRAPAMPMSCYEH